MPVDVLSAGHRAAYGRYSEPPSAAQLERFFHFDERDRELIDRRRGDHNRLGFAVQLGTVRFLGTFLARPAAVPQVVAARVGEELGVHPGCLSDYAKREPTHREHAGEIQREYGYRDFSEASAQAELSTWLDARAWATAERPSVLFDLATARLIESKVLLPGASVLARASPLRVIAPPRGCTARSPKQPARGAAVLICCSRLLRRSSSRVWRCCALGRAS